VKWRIWQKVLKQLPPLNHYSAKTMKTKSTITLTALIWLALSTFRQSASKTGIGLCVQDPSRRR
jgi:hypothetical protein